MEREERLQDVPASITALTLKDIERRGITNMDDYMRSLPGAYRMELGSSRKNPIIVRGIAARPEVEDAAVGVYFGEVPLVSSAGSTDWFGGADVAMVDIEQVELLRGPQGTLYGSGSLAGTVRIRPAQPDLKALTGKFDLGYSDTSGYGGANYLGNAVVNLPLVQDHFAVRLVGYKHRNSGYIRNVIADLPPGVPSYALDAIPFGATLKNEDDIGRTDMTGGRLSASWQPNDVFSASYTFAHQKTEQLGIPELMLSLGTYQQAFLQLGPTATRGDGQDSAVDINNLVLSVDLGWATVLSSSSYIKTEGNFRRDVTIAGLGPVSQLARAEFDEFAQEVRLTSSLRGPLQFIVGAFYEDSSKEALGRNFWTGTVALNPYAIGTSFDPQIAEVTELADVKHKSMFGEISYELLTGLTGTLGARTFSYDKSLGGMQYIPVFGLNSRDTTEISSDESGSTFKASLSYKPSDETLFYGSWSEGFRLGAPVGPLSFPSVCDPDGDGSIIDANGNPVHHSDNLESDTVDNLEIGTKFAMLDGRARISIAAYSIKWDKLPITIFDAGGVCSATLNAGEARSRGIELETSFQVTPGFRAEVGLSYVNAELVEDAGSLGSKGDRLPGSPKFNANAALNYDFQVSGNDVYARADLVYVGEFFNNLQQAGTPAGDYYQLNLRSGIALGSVGIDLFVDNVMNADDLTYVYSTLADGRAYRLRPRTIGAELHWRF